MRGDLKRIFPAALAALTLVAAPLLAATAFAADAQLYEVTENMKLVGKKVAYRRATSELMGVARANTPLCPMPVDCTINATGSNNISLATGLGTFGGTFTVVVQGDNAADSPEAVVARGGFSGKMDFSPAILRGVPLGTVVGKMQIDGRHRPVPFTGTFRLPFVLPYPDAALFGALPLPLTPFPTKFYVGQKDAAGKPICQSDDTSSCTRPLYLDDSGSPFPLTAEEYGLGYPTVRFDVTF
jgi:hypothetical protein